MMPTIRHVPWSEVMSYMQIVADNGTVATVGGTHSPNHVVLNGIAYQRPTFGYARVLEPDAADVIGILTLANFTVEEIP